MDKLFEQYDNVYWSQSETNHPTLAEYYKRKGMVYLGTDEQEDFRPSAPNTKFLANIFLFDFCIKSILFVLSSN